MGHDPRRITYWEAPPSCCRCDSDGFFVVGIDGETIPLSPAMDREPLYWCERCAEDKITELREAVK